MNDTEIVGGSGETSHWPAPRQREAWMDHGEAVEVVVGEMKALLTDARPYVSRCVDQDRRSWRDGAAQAVLRRIDTILSGDDA